MLGNDDLRWLVQQIVGTSELLGQEITPTAAAMLAGDLSCYPKAVLASALSRVRTEHTGKLTPKAILDRIDEAAGRPAANEAWAIALEALDERKTVVWTQEMAQAWKTASVVAESGDIVGARMTFISTYERLVRVAREERRVPEVVISEGHDPQHRIAAVQRAVQIGYLPEVQARGYLPALGQSDPAISVKLIGGKQVLQISPPPHLRQKLAEQREQLAGKAIERAQASARKAEEQARDVAERKAKTAKAVDDYQKGPHEPFSA